MRFAQSFDFLIPISCESDLDFVIAITRKRVRNQCATARAQWKTFHVLLLSYVRRNSKCKTIQRTPRRADSEATDFLSCRNVSIQQRRRENADGYIVKAMTA